jgi:hypothetical protein
MRVGREFSRKKTRRKRSFGVSEFRMAVLEKRGGGNAE